MLIIIIDTHLYGWYMRKIHPGRCIETWSGTFPD